MKNKFLIFATVLLAVITFSSCTSQRKTVAQWLLIIPVSEVDSFFALFLFLK